MIERLINQIILGDCIEVIRTLPDQYVDCMIVDPPYSSGARRDAEKTVRGSMLRSDKYVWFSHDNMSTTGFQWFIREMLVALKTKLKPQAACFMFTDWRQYPTIAQIIESAGYRLNDLIVWDKIYFGLGSHFRNQHELISFFSNGAPRKAQRRDIANLIKVKNVSSRKKVHPTQKPEELLRLLIGVTTKERDLVFDPMCGSGTTCIAAFQLDRDYLGVEINPAYVEVAKGRLIEAPEKLTDYV